VDKLTGRLRELGNQILEWWNRFTVKQKTLLICGMAVVAVAVVGVVSMLTKPQYVLLRECETASEAAEVKELLDGEEFKYTVSDDALTFRILRDQQADARMLLAANNIRAAGYTIDQVTEGSFSTTESDKEKKNVVYLQDYLAKDMIENFSAIKSARVQLSIPQNDGTLLATEEEAYAWVLLELRDEFSVESSAALARAVATAIGNETTDHIVIMDYDGNMLYSGDEDYSVTGTANAQLSVKAEAEKQLINQVRKVLLGTNQFNNVEVATNLVMDFSTTQSTSHTYSAPSGRTEGMLSHEDIFSSESESSVAGIPGTDSNGDDDTTYVLPDNGGGNSSQTEETRDYLPDEEITTKNTPAGVIDYAQSSLMASMVRYNIVREEDARTRGDLEGVSWEEYKLANSERTRMEVEEDLVTAVANATGISAESISLVAYSENIFFDAEGSGITATDIIQIVLIVVILALLAFVVLRSMRSEKHEEEEEEISVETLLQSTPEAQLEDIMLENESEERKLINKFVDENPEAAANLLRNWLNEDWG
jgi:flagellar M-ring protein FliF